MEYPRRVPAIIVDSRASFLPTLGLVGIRLPEKQNTNECHSSKEGKRRTMVHRLFVILDCAEEMRKQVPLRRTDQGLQALLTSVLRFS